VKRGLIVTSILLIALSLYGIVESSRLERTMKMGIGIGFLPFSMSLLIGVLAVILLVSILKGRMKIKEGPICSPGGAPRAVMMVGLLAAYLILIDAIGYTLSTFLFFAASVHFLARGRLLKTLLTGAAFTFFLYAIFRVWLRSPLPAGFLGI
jgi:putative tricarboxylic transport membrane protein